jgi:hypothetical protein
MYVRVCVCVCVCVCMYACDSPEGSGQNCSAMDSRDLWSLILRKEVNTYGHSWDLHSLERVCNVVQLNSPYNDDRFYVSFNKSENIDSRKTDHGMSIRLQLSCFLLSTSSFPPHNKYRTPRHYQFHCILYQTCASSVRKYWFTICGYDSNSHSIFFSYTSKFNFFWDLFLHIVTKTTSFNLITSIFSFLVISMLKDCGKKYFPADEIRSPLSSLVQEAVHRCYILT